MILHQKHLSSSINQVNQALHNHLHHNVSIHISQIRIYTKLYTLPYTDIYSTIPYPNNIIIQFYANTYHHTSSNTKYKYNYYSIILPSKFKYYFMHESMNTDHSISTYSIYILNLFSKLGYSFLQYTTLVKQSFYYYYNYYYYFYLGSIYK